MSQAIKYSVVEGWEQLPKGYVHKDVAGVAVDGEDRVYLMCRGDHPVVIYDQKGKFLRSWGEGEFTYRTHGIYVAPNGTIFCTDDGNHTVRQFTPEGKLLMTMGTMNTPSDTGYDGKNTASIKRAAGPFPFLSVSTSPEAQYQCARVWVTDRCPTASAPIWRGAQYRHLPDDAGGHRPGAGIP